MVPREKNLWNGHTPEFGGTRVLRKVEQLVGEGFVRQRLFLAKHAGYESGQRIEHNRRSQGTIGQHVIPDADLLVDHPIANPLIYTLVMAAQ